MGDFGKRKAGRPSTSLTVPCLQYLNRQTGPETLASTQFGLKSGPKRETPQWDIAAHSRGCSYGTYHLGVGTYALAVGANSFSIVCLSLVLSLSAKTWKT